MESEPENYSSLKIDEADQIDELVGRYDELLLEIEDLGKEIEAILGQVTAIQQANPEVLVDFGAPTSHNSLSSLASVGVPTVCRNDIVS
ncbi:MAG: hypothetical protein FJ308_02665 [Planctomycetes bacterium]|nr:hypothetical protein [Planctomycetota bacterium]